MRPQSSERWTLIADQLGIVEERRVVYLIGRRAYLDKRAALRAGLKMLAASLDTCSCSRGDEITPGYDCGCRERREAFVTRMEPLYRALPGSLSEIERRLEAYQDDGLYRWPLPRSENHDHKPTPASAFASRSSGGRQREVPSDKQSL